MPQLHIIGTCITSKCQGIFLDHDRKTFRPKEIHNAFSFISNSARETGVGWLIP